MSDASEESSKVHIPHRNSSIIQTLQMIRSAGDLSLRTFSCHMPIERHHLPHVRTGVLKQVEISAEAHLAVAVHVLEYWEHLHRLERSYIV